MDKLSTVSGVVADRNGGMPGQMPTGGRPQSRTARGVPYRTLFRLGLYVVRGAPISFLLTTALSVSSILLQQLQPQLLGSVIVHLQSAGAPRASSHRDASWLLPQSATAAVGALAALTIGSILFGIAERVLMTWSDLKMLSKLQQRLHDRLLTLGPRYHALHSVGETSAIVSRFATGAELVLRDLIASPLVRGISLVTAVALLVNNVSNLGPAQPELEVVLVLAVLSMPLVGVGLSKRMRAFFTTARDSELAVAEELQNSLSQPLEAQLMGANSQRSQSFARRLARHSRNLVAASSRNEIANQVQGMIPTLLRLGFLAYGTLRAATTSDPVAAGAVVSLYGLVPLAVQPIQQLVQYYNGLNSTWPQVERVAEILDAQPEVTERVDAVRLSDGPCDVAIDRATFRYSANLEPVLDQLSCSFDHGHVTALVGASGSGKSTIFNLLARLTDPEEGHVRVGGIDLRDVLIADLRRRVVRVAQFPLFIADSVRENFRLAKEDATDAEIERVCRATGLWEVLVRASAGAPLDYHLPRDVSQGLSGGQRRLLAVSRALLHQPLVLLLDEPTAGIDNITLQVLMKFIKSVSAGMAVILIDHDLEGFVAHIADRICVLDGGKIVTSGTHSELMARGGLYRRLVQGAAEVKATAPEVSRAPVAMQPPKMSGDVVS